MVGSKRKGTLTGLAGIRSAKGRVTKEASSTAFTVWTHSVMLALLVREVMY